MARITYLVFVLNAIAGCVSAAPSPSNPTAPAAQRDAAAIITEFDGITYVEFDSARGKEPGYIDQYQKSLRAADLRKAVLAKALYDAFPLDPKAGEMMVRRWGWLIQHDLDWQTTARESKQFLDAHPDSPRKADALHHRAAALAHIGTMDEAMPVIEQFIALKPEDDERGGYLLEVLSEQPKNDARWKALQQRIVQTYKGTRTAVRAAGRLRKADGVGKPFKLAFTDVRSGKPITIAALKGKVVIVDFWATWCAPCVAELPKLKALYAQYKDKGVEFIGVSLDVAPEEGGLEKLTAFLEKEEISWPQYYQGNGWKSDFSTSWGIDSVPALFIIDADGNLHSADARERLNELISELLRKRDG